MYIRSAVTQFRLRDARFRESQIIVRRSCVILRGPSSLNLTDAPIKRHNILARVSTRARAHTHTRARAYPRRRFMLSYGGGGVFVRFISTTFVRTETARATQYDDGLDRNVPRTLTDRRMTRNPWRVCVAFVENVFERVPACTTTTRTDCRRYDRGRRGRSSMTKKRKKRDRWDSTDSTRFVHVRRAHDRRRVVGNTRRSGENAVRRTSERVYYRVFECGEPIAPPNTHAESEGERQKKRVGTRTPRWNDNVRASSIKRTGFHSDECVRTRCVETIPTRIGCIRCMRARWYIRRRQYMDSSGVTSRYVRLVSGNVNKTRNNNHVCSPRHLGDPRISWTPCETSNSLSWCKRYHTITVAPWIPNCYSVFTAENYSVRTTRILREAAGDRNNTLLCKTKTYDTSVDKPEAKA